MSTLSQMGCHVSFLTKLTPPLIRGEAFTPTQTIKGLRELCQITSQPKVLPPSYLIKLAELKAPTFEQLCVQMQAALGLRATHFAKLCPVHYHAATVLLPPFKFQSHSVLISLHHVPAWLLSAYLHHPRANQRDVHSPIIPWSSDQYKKIFRALAAHLGLNYSTHSARHTFATVQAMLRVPRQVIAQYLVHKNVSTTAIYIHSLSMKEQQCIAAHQEYFKPCSILFAPAALT